MHREDTRGKGEWTSGTGNSIAKAQAQSNSPGINFGQEEPYRLVELCAKADLNYGNLLHVKVWMVNHWDLPSALDRVAIAWTIRPFYPFIWPRPWRIHCGWVKTRQLDWKSIYRSSLPNRACVCMQSVVVQFPCFLFLSFFFILGGEISCLTPNEFSFYLLSLCIE